MPGEDFRIFVRHLHAMADMCLHCADTSLGTQVLAGMTYIGARKAALRLDNLPPFEDLYKLLMAELQAATDTERMATRFDDSAPLYAQSIPCLLYTSDAADE